MANLKHIQNMYPHKKNDIQNHDSMETLSEDKIKQIEEKQAQIKAVDDELLGHGFVHGLPTEVHRV